MFVCSECGWAQPMDGRCNDGTPLASIGDDLILGTTIGVYRVARLLGIGGMGRVYKAVHPQIGSRVAIKVLSRECSDRKDLVDRFFAEARAVNLIRHESIVNVLDLSVLPDGRPFIIMEYLDGQPLSAIIAGAQQAGTPLPLGGIARLAVEVLDALGAAHAKGIIHRDLKPDNVFVTPGGRPKVLDFGIAKLLPELGGSATQTGSLLGTPHYMSPEQASGAPLDHRADLYAMGVILFECATLHKPFVADSLFELLRMHIEVPPPAPSTSRPDITPQLDNVIVTSLGKRPDERFSTAAAMSAAIQNATSQLASGQWAPIAPARGSIQQVSNPNWAGTPPSWAGLRAQQVASPPMPPQHRLGNAETVASGKRPTVAVVPAMHARSGSKTGWFVLGGLAIVVAGGVATVALLAGGGGGGAAPTEVAQPRPIDKPTAKTETHKAAKPTDPDDDEIDRRIDQTIDHTMAKIDEDIEKSFAQAGMPSPTAATKAAPAKATPAPTPTPEAPPPPDDYHTPDGWLVRHDLRGPAGFDPKNVDVATFVAYATAEAKKSMPDAKLIRFLADNVDRTGHADLTLPSFASPSGTVDVRFISPSHVPPDPKGHKPFGFEWKCEFRVEASPEGVEIRAIDGSPCTEDAVRAPRCSPGSLWPRVRTAIPATKTRADLDYRDLPTSGKAGWYFEIKGIAEEMFSDDC